MLDIRPFLLSLVSFLVFQHTAPPQRLAAHVDKSVAIVGGGTAGLAMLYALVDLQDELDNELEIVLYEQRRDVGGIWLPDLNPVHPPVLPETPLYPLLHTNTPVPSMTFPGFPFPPGTPLYPSHDYVERYHQAFASRYNLWPYISLSHTVLSASWIGTPEVGRWDVRVGDQDGHETRRSFDHLVVANGHNHYPHIPTFPGQEAWLRHGRGTNDKQREILHSIFYRDPDRYANQTVLVVGSGASGRDIALQVALYARKMYLSVHHLDFATPDSITVKSEIVHFTHDAIVFADGSHVQDVDAVILGTGYDLRFPFFETTGEVDVKPGSSKREHGLTTNLRYLFPLHEHIFSLSASYPTNALAFIGLPIFAYNFPVNYAQSIYSTRVILNGSCIDTREELLATLDANEDGLRMAGYDPYDAGHRFVDESAFDYEDRLINVLKAQGTIPDDGNKYVEAWRREAHGYKYLKQAWKRVEELGVEREWLKGVETEAEWADMMKRLNEWQEDWEASKGPVAPDDAAWF